MDDEALSLVGEFLDLLTVQRHGDHIVVSVLDHPGDTWSTCYLTPAAVEVLARRLDRLYDLAVDPA